MTKRNPLVRDPRDYPYRIVRKPVRVPLWRRITEWFTRLWLNWRRKPATDGPGPNTFYRAGMAPPVGYAFNRRGDLVNLRREFMRRGGVA